MATDCGNALGLNEFVACRKAEVWQVGQLVLTPRGVLPFNCFLLEKLQ